MGKSKGSKRARTQARPQQQQQPVEKKTPLEQLQESWTEEISWIKANVSALIELSGVDRQALDAKVFENMGLHKLEVGSDIQQYDELVMDITATNTETGAVIDSLSARALKFKVGTQQILDFLEKAICVNGYASAEPFLLTGANGLWKDESLPESVTFNFTYHRGTRLIVNQEAYLNWLRQLKVNLATQFDYLPETERTVVTETIESFNTAREVRSYVNETHDANVHARTEWFMNIVKEYVPTYNFEGKTLPEIMTEAMKLRIEDAKAMASTPAPTESPAETTTTEA